MMCTPLRLLILLFLPLAMACDPAASSPLARWLGASVEGQGAPVLQCTNAPHVAAMTRRSAAPTRSCILARPMRLEGQRCEQGGRATLHDNGRLKSCRVERTIVESGVMCTGTIELNPSGKVTACVAHGPQEAQGLTCSGRVEFFAGTGALRECKTTATWVRVGDLNVPGHSHITLSESGAIRRIRTTGGRLTQVQSYQCTETTHYASGAVKTCLNRRDSGKNNPGAVTSEQRLALASRVCFDEQGARSTRGDWRCRGR